MQKFYLKTFGCQMNEHDSQKMEALLAQDGYEKTASLEEAELVVVNTCSIREKSYQKALSEIGRMGGKGVVAVTGCVASHEGKKLLKRFPFVDIVLGPDHIASLPKLVHRAKENSEKFCNIDFHDLSDYEFPSPIRLESPDRKQVTAYVTVMKGCDNACSFCIVPFVRGPEISRPAEDIVGEIKRLQEQGVREVTLLGQNVNSYGRGLPQNSNFAKLLRKIDEETSIQRIRYTSPHPKDLSNALVEEYSRNRKLCPHIHLPVQSGSDRILKKMRRSYTRTIYLRKVAAIRKVIPDIAMTTDLIVGFPGETDDDFEETLSLMREVGFDQSYSFSFSPRPNTEASQFSDDVPGEVKKERLTRLQVIQSEIALAKNSLRIGRSEEVLVEECHPGKEIRFSGRTPHGKVVNFLGADSRPGDTLKVKITGASAYALKGMVENLC